MGARTAARREKWGTDGGCGVSPVRRRANSQEKHSTLRRKEKTPRTSKKGKAGAIYRMFKARTHSALSKGSHVGIRRAFRKNLGVRLRPRRRRGEKGKRISHKGGMNDIRPIDEFENWPRRPKGGSESP